MSRGSLPPERTPRTDDAVRVLHLDHTGASGGAEFALLRMLQAGPRWAPYLLIAPGEEGAGVGVYAAVPARIPRRVAGVRQPAGVSAGGRAVALVVGARVLAQAAVVRCARAFQGADVVDANTARAAAYGALAVRGTRKAFVVHLRDLVEPDALGRAGHALMVRVVLPRADGVVANSRATLESARPYLRPGVPAEVIPSASGLRPRGSARRPEPLVAAGPAGLADAAGQSDSASAAADDEMPADGRPEVPTDGEAAEGMAAETGATIHADLPAASGPVRTVGMLARIDPWKGQAQLLEAFARVFRGRDTRLQLAGGAPFGHESFAESLRRRAGELGVAGQLDLPGHVDDVDGLLSGWDVAVQASTRAEPLGQNVLQYLAAGLPVIAADEGGPAEWITAGVNGLLVPPRDVAALAAALERLDADAALRARLAASAAATPGLLDDHAVTRAHQAFYERVLRAASDRRRGRLS